MESRCQREECAGIGGGIEGKEGGVLTVYVARSRIFYDKRMSQEVMADALGDEFKGYVLRITGGNDVRFVPSLGVGTPADLPSLFISLSAIAPIIPRQFISIYADSRLESIRPNSSIRRLQKQGFPMKQGVLVPSRVKLLLSKGHSCFRPRKTGERKRRSVRGCIVQADIRALALVVVKQGENDIPGLTDQVLPKRLGPKVCLFPCRREEERGTAAEERLWKSHRGTVR